jgi:hypothetical protein
MRLRGQILTEMAPLQVKRIDKKKLPDDRHRADEAVLNMQRFITYKMKERS